MFGGTRDVEWLWVRGVRWYENVGWLWARGVRWYEDVGVAVGEGSSVVREMLSGCGRGEFGGTKSVGVVVGEGSSVVRGGGVGGRGGFLGWDFRS